MKKLREVTKRFTAILLSGMLIIGSASGSVFASSTDTDPGQTSEAAIEDIVTEEAIDTSQEKSSATTVSWAGISYEEVAGVRGVYTAYLSFDATEYLLMQQASFDYYDTIGVVTGKINYDSEYISLISVEANEWMSSFNDGNGKFNTVKSSGAYSASPLKITYKIIKACPYGAELIQVNDIVFSSTRFNSYIESAPLSLVIKTDHCEEHAYDDWEIITPASCTGDGLRKKSCVDCGDAITEEIPATGHKWDEEYTVDKEASCTEEGSESIHCSVCNVIDESTIRAVQKKEHAYDSGKITKQATCTEAGSREKICADCGDKVTEDIPATGHKWNEGYTVDKEATYTEEGSESIYCSVCGEIKEGSSRAIAKLRKPVSMLDITGIKTLTYSGRDLMQTIVIKDGASILEEDIDYTVSYSNNVNAGTGTLVIKGKGNYTGTKTITFKITKAAQSITAKASSASVAVGKTATVSITGNKGNKSFKSSNTAVATVSSTGKVTAKKVGKVTITATSAATSNYNAASKTVTIKVVPAATSSFTAANQATGIKLTWKKAAGANAYFIYRGSTQIAAIRDSSTVSYTDKKANINGTKYTYKIIASASATGRSTLSKSVTTYCVARPAISSAINSAAGKMTVKWGKNAKATGYQIQYCPDKTFKTGNKSVSINSASTVSKVIGNLAKGKTYYVRIRTFKTVGSTKYFSAWSAVKSVKITK